MRLKPRARFSCFAAISLLVGLSALWPVWSLELIVATSPVSGNSDESLLIDALHEIHDG
jgi:hypothetical protein